MRLNEDFPALLKAGEKEDFSWTFLSKWTEPNQRLNQNTHFDFLSTILKNRAQGTLFYLDSLDDVLAFDALHIFTGSCINPKLISFIDE